MMGLFPKRAVYHSRLTPKKLIRKLDGELVEYRPTLNILSAGKFMREHKTESIYYGRHSADRFELYYHRAKHRDGSSTGFYGRIEPEEGGCVIKGYYRKPLYAYFVAVLWVLLCLACAVGAYAADKTRGAYIILGLALVGTVMILFDRHERYLRVFLEGLEDKDREQR